jgi:hypothetical protein
MKKYTYNMFTNCIPATFAGTQTSCDAIIFAGEQKQEKDYSNKVT